MSESQKPLQILDIFNTQNFITNKDFVTYKAQGIVTVPNGLKFGDGSYLNGDLYSVNGTLVLDLGTDGTDATFNGDVNGDLYGDIFNGDSTKIFDSGNDSTAPSFTRTIKIVETGGTYGSDTTGSLELYHGSGNTSSIIFQGNGNDYAFLRYTDDWTNISDLNGYSELLLGDSVQGYENEKSTLFIGTQNNGINGGDDSIVIRPAASLVLDTGTSSSEVSTNAGNIYMKPNGGSVVIGHPNIDAVIGNPRKSYQGVPLTVVALDSVLETQENIYEVLKLERKLNDINSAVTSDYNNDGGGYIGMHVNDQNSTAELARIAWRATNSNVSERSGKIEFYTANNINNNGQPAKRMTINYNGNVGIGTETPTSLLDVNGTVTVEGDLQVGGEYLPDSNNNFKFGTDALANVTTSGYNVGIGFESLKLLTSGFGSNIAIGYQAGYNHIGYNNVFIGAGAGYDSANPSATYTFFNSTAIGSGAEITASNQVALGTSGTTVTTPGAFECPDIFFNANDRDTGIIYNSNNPDSFNLKAGNNDIFSVSQNQTTTNGTMIISETGDGTFKSSSGGTLTLSHANSGGTNSIVFQNADRADNYAAINYIDNINGELATYPEFDEYTCLQLSGGSNASVLSITSDLHADPDATNSNRGGDSIVIRPSSHLILDTGNSNKARDDDALIIVNPTGNDAGCLVVGKQSSTTSGYRLEVSGDSLFEGNVEATGNITGNNIFADSILIAQNQPFSFSYSRTFSDLVSDGPILTFPSGLSTLANITLRITANISADVTGTTPNVYYQNHTYITGLLVMYPGRFPIGIWGANTTGTNALYYFDKSGGNSSLIPGSTPWVYFNSGTTATNALFGSTIIQEESFGSTWSSGTTARELLFLTGSTREIRFHCKNTRLGTGETDYSITVEILHVNRYWSGDITYTENGVGRSNHMPIVIG